MVETLIKNFAQISKADIKIAGGKGASLGEMTQAGIPVPGGFVILSNVFDKFIEETNLDIEINAVLDTVDIKEVHTVENASEKIQAMILSREMPEDINKEILRYFKKLNSKFVAVRSSATSEDSASVAWAGLLDSFLNTTDKTLLENVKKCWASLFTSRAIFYRFEKKLSQKKISVAVVVQKMVNSEKSGTAFSVHPVTQDKNQIIIEAGFGLGEAVVSGAITPDSYVVSKRYNKIIDINIHEQTKALYKKQSGGNEWKNFEEKGMGQVLSKKDILKLAEIVKKIECHYKIPQDIEWAFANSEFYITQSRPITTIESMKKERVHVKETEYQLHFTADSNEFSIYILKGMLYGDKTYGVVDYIIIYEPPTVRAYLSPKGLDEAYKISEKLLDDDFFEKLMKDALQLDKEYLKYKKVSKLTDSNLLSLWKKNHSLTKESIRIYRHFEQPFQQALEQEILKTISKEKLIKILSHEHFDKLPDAETKKYVNRLLEMGKVKLKLHEDSEIFFTDDIFLRYVSEKHNLPMEIVGAMGVNEFEKALRGKLTVTTNELKERLKGSVFVKENDKWNLYTGEQYNYWKNKMQGAYNGEVVGDIAFSGIAKGYVIIHLSWTNTTDVNDGDVLVTGMTNPQMIPLLKKASAIVTDEGGITCHAAIISRELRKPCIVGTKNATQVLHDGDLVEVNANEGFIHIIEKSKK